MLIDTHCHLDFERYDKDRESVLRRAKETGVGRVVVPAVDYQSWSRVIELAESHEMVYGALGIHPNSASDLPPDWLDELSRLARHPRIVAIGEIGLDYYRMGNSKERQTELLLAQLEVASGAGLPVILHSRESNRDMLDLLGTWCGSNDTGSGVLHSFSGTSAEAVEANDLGIYIGITGPVTYKKSIELRVAVKAVEGRWLVIETDGPFLAPQRFRGRRNEPAYVGEVAARVAEVRGSSIEDIAELTTANARRLFPRLA